MLGDRRSAPHHRASETRAVVVVLGCRYDAPRERPQCPDHVKLDTLASLYPRARVCGSTEFETDAASTSHVSAYWHRSLATVILRTSPTFVVLDYFWLQRSYYRERYGTNWLDRKLRELLACSQFVALFLPFDAGDDGNGLGGDMRGMLSRVPHDLDADVELIADDDAHPLARAARVCDRRLRELAQSVAAARGRVHDVQVRRLARETPFVVAYRRGADWRARLGELADAY